MRTTRKIGALWTLAAAALASLATVLALRSKYGEPRKPLSDPMRYVDATYVEKAEVR